MSVPTSSVFTLFFFVGAPLLIWWLRRSRIGVTHGLRVSSRTALTRNGVVAVVETDGRRFLVGATDHGINLLTELALPPSEPQDTIDDVTDDDAAALTLLTGTGPGTSPIDALRNMTVRRPTRSRTPGARRLP